MVLFYFQNLVMVEIGIIQQFLGFLIRKTVVLVVVVVVIVEMMMVGDGDNSDSFGDYSNGDDGDGG